MVERRAGGSKRCRDESGWFWQTNDLNAFADKGDMLGQTKRINGGTNGLQERVTLFGKARVFITNNGVK